MFNKISSFFRTLTIFFLFIANIFTSELPTEILGFQLGAKYKTLKNSVSLKRTKLSFEKIYKVVYNEGQSIETYLYFFNKKIYKIVISYPDKIIGEEDWENIYNQASLLYGKPQKVIIVQQNSLLQEIYMWENQKIKYVYKITNKDNKLQNFIIELTDKSIEQKISRLSFIEKIFFIIINLF